jgi:hypothetical protein
MKNYILFVAIAALIVSCQLKNPDGEETTKNSDFQQGIAKDVLQTSNYTYILFEMDGSDVWIAAVKMDAVIGQKYYFVQNMEMENFESKELNRTFDKILFVQQISTDPNSFKEQSHNQSDFKTEVKVTKQDVKIDLGKGIKSIADVYSNKNKYNGTIVTVKGVVTKYNPEIMNKNWIHLQDGTDSDGRFDLAIATLVNSHVGDTLTLEGKLVLDKDFGYGYKYDLLIEDAVKK